MTWAKRIVSACLALTFSGFSALAAAPAHGHSLGENVANLVHAIAVDDSGHHGVRDHGHGALDQDEMEHHQHDGVNQSGDAKHPHDGSFHVHDVSHFGPVVLAGPLGSRVVAPLKQEFDYNCAPATGSFSLPHRPPRHYL